MYCVKTLISIIGPTGIGKTRLAIDLANHFDTEIISCDSRQFFKEMSIGTAKPSQEELEEIPHHFVGHLSVSDYYSIGQYENDAVKKISQLFQKLNVVILVGGSMMYEKAIIHGLHNLPEANDENQKKWISIWENQGLEELQKILQSQDPEYYAVVDKDNPRRILRALDVIQQTGKKYSEIIAEPLHKRDFRVIRIGIDAPREIIYSRINNRVDTMLQSGLVAEVEKLIKYQHLPSLQTVGYCEIFKFLENKIDLDFAVSEIKKNSRRFAKRQLTWYRKEENIHWVNFKYPLQESLSLLEQLL